MFKINENFLNLSQSYLFSTIAKKVDAFMKENPDARIIRMGIGDVTRPLAPAVIEAMHKAVDNLASGTTFRGYGPEQGYQFLRRAISDNDYKSHDIEIDEDEIFISDGAKSDTANILDILGARNTIALTDPVYPVYFDSNIMAGRTQEARSIIKLACNESNHFIPQLPKESVDVIYLCYPNNPTGTTLTRDQLRVFVDYALEHESLILFDSAYEAFITSENVPHSIYEIEGAEKCAIEFRSFSKTAGFTGVRCGYTVIPKGLKAKTAKGDISLRDLWNRRQTTKFNGASYVAQRAAEAIYTPEGKSQIKETIEYYLENARILREGLSEIGFDVYGGKDAPYIWMKSKDGLTSWELFDILLQKYHIVTTPGVGFGAEGEGFIRLTAFNTHENTIEAINRLKNTLD